MDFAFFKDVLFDLINECERFDILSIDTYDAENRFVIHTPEGQSFELRLTKKTEPTAQALGMQNAECKTKL